MNIPFSGIDGILDFSDFYKFFSSISILVYVFIALGSVFLLIMTKNEYRTYLTNRVINLNQNRHQLSIEEVLENEYRDKIIEEIINQPGIHYKELFRKINTSASNLTWHLDVLESYKIIHKQRIGRYLILFKKNRGLTKKLYQKD